MVYTLRFFFSSKCSLFHISNVFGSCFIHILYTGYAKIKKNNSGAKRLRFIWLDMLLCLCLCALYAFLKKAFYVFIHIFPSLSEHLCAFLIQQTLLSHYIWYFLIYLDVRWLQIFDQPLLRTMPVWRKTYIECWWHTS